MDVNCNCSLSATGVMNSKRVGYASQKNVGEAFRLPRDGKLVPYKYNQKFATSEDFS